MGYRKRDFPNSTKRLAENNDAVWRVPDVLVVDTSGQAVASAEGKLKWTVYVKKQLITGVNAYFQVASDPMRGIRLEFGR